MVLRKDSLTFVGLQHANFDFSLGKTNYKFTVSFVRPSHACDGGSLSKLVANGFLISPLGPEAVDEDDIVRLRQGKLLGVGRECKGSHYITAVFLVGGSDVELVFLHALVVVEVYSAVGSGHGLSLRVGRPCNS